MHSNWQHHRPVALNSARSSHVVHPRQSSQLHVFGLWNHRIVPATSATLAQPSESSQHGRFDVVITMNKTSYKVQAAIRDAPIPHMAPVVPAMWNASICRSDSNVGSAHFRGHTVRHFSQHHSPSTQVTQWGTWRRSTKVSRSNCGSLEKSGHVRFGQGQSLQSPNSRLGLDQELHDRSVTVRSPTSTPCGKDTATDGPGISTSQDRDASSNHRCSHRPTFRKEQGHEMDRQFNRPRGHAGNARQR